MAENNGPQQGPDDESGKPQNPFEMLFGSLGFGAPGSPEAQGQPDLQAMMQQFQQALSQMGMGGMFGGPTSPADAEGARWTQIRDVARRAVAGRGADPTPSARDLDDVRDAVRLADSWLDGATQFPATGGRVAAWSRADWVESTMPTWRRLIDPVAESLADAMVESMAPGDQTDDPTGLGGLEALLRPWLRSSGSTIFGLQAGQAIGELAASVMGATEVSLPLSGDHVGTIALVPTNVRAFGEGLGQSRQDVSLYLALRECARQRLYASVPWLGPQMLALVEQYARGITIDLSGIEEAVAGVDPTGMTPETMQDLSQQLQGTLFAPRQTPDQLAVLERLETLLALVEGWVDEVVGRATARWMPNAAALAEALRRRHAAGGPIEATFKALVGLELRPRRLRDAANLWAALRDARGDDGRDAVWNHPDLLPTTADLDDPLGFVAGERRAPEKADPDAVSDEVDDMDAELERLLDEAERDRGADGPDDRPGGDDPGAGGPGDGTRR